jgi:hypothetical protein
MKFKIILVIFLSLAVATMLVTPAFADDEYEDGAGSDSDGAWGWSPPKGDHFGASDGPAPGSSGDGDDGYGNGGGGYGGGGGFFGGRGRFGSSGGASSGGSRTKLGGALSRLPSLVTSFFGNNSTIVPSVVQPKPNQENSPAEKDESRGIDDGSKAKVSTSTDTANSKSDDLRINEPKLKKEPSDEDLSKGT